MELKARTPKLYNALRRIFQPSELELLETAFEFVQATGGEEEIGFIRPVDQSFNPRLARVALILIEEGRVAGLHNVCAALLSCSSAPGQFRIGLEGVDDYREIAGSIELAQLAQKTISEIVDSSSSLNSVALAIAGALRLDYVRHLHRTSLYRDLGQRGLEIELNDRLIQILDRQTEGEGSRIAQLLRSWNERERKKFAGSVGQTTG